MQEFGGPESLSPGEGVAPGSEQLSEAAKQRFAQAHQQIKQIIREEKRAKKRDDRVAETIRQFLGEAKYSHLFQLISRLAARDCPSIFILAILSLIHKGSRETVEEYIAEHRVVIELPETKGVDLKGKQGLPQEAREILILWTTRLELVLQTDAEKILSRLMVDEGNIDGTVLQLTTFVLVDFFEKLKFPIPFADLQPLTIKILQDILEPHMELMAEYFAKLKENSVSLEDKDEEEE